MMYKLPSSPFKISLFLISSFMAANLLSGTVLAEFPAGEILYNGIQLPKEWPPNQKPDGKIHPLPYLVQPPAVIPIDIGRQLFVDDFLIEKSDLKRQFHYATRYEGNPILKPETPLELKNGEQTCATPFNDGLWWDPKDQLFKLWYHAGFFSGTGYATSKDGLKWERPELDIVKGTNRLLPVEGHGERDGTAIWLDHNAADPLQRFKMFLFERPQEKFGGMALTSPDGIHWTIQAKTSLIDGKPVGDSTTIFYNPFRKKWVYCIRTGMAGRGRSYRECDDFVAGATWEAKEVVPLAIADELDLPDPGVQAMKPKTPEEIQKMATLMKKTPEEIIKRIPSDYMDRPHLYNLDAVPYESIMLGIVGILVGPNSSPADALKMPKLIDLKLAYSRDGFSWDRPDHTPFLAATRKEGDWDRAYLHTATSICAIVEDRLYFYYGGWSGISPKRGTDLYSGGATGVAFLRRDGFVSLNAEEPVGSITTRPVTFKGKYLFTNINAPKGELRVEVLDENNAVIAPFSAENCVPFTGDKTRTKITWKDSADLSALSGKKVKFRFLLKNGELYAFWVSPDLSGASYGYVAAGGPGFVGPIDNVGGKRE